MLEADNEHQLDRKGSNEKVQIMINEKRELLETIDNRRGKMVTHLIRHDNLLKTMLKEKIEGKRKRGRPRISNIQQ